ncbi:hypothetical protein [Kineococcus terrestris]|uniref:hypothetical protein n=1 Tax=Kineococcus terrestris TaxID=2044856 RepID=UPI0034DB3B33
MNVVDWPVTVYNDGAIRLGSGVVADGFHPNIGVRVQSHAHQDHLHNFNRSKGIQDIVMLSGTRDLLIAQRNADLPLRSNIIGLEAAAPYPVAGGHAITLLPSGHTVGSAQVAVVEADGVRLGYSGDFAWPLHDVIDVDYLVVDATYGNPASIRRFSQGEAEQALVEVTVAALARGSVYVKALSGTLQRAAAALCGAIAAPILASQRICKEIDVYRSHGFPIDPVIKSERVAADEQLAQTPHFVRLLGPGDEGRAAVPASACFIVLSGFLGRGPDPVEEYVRGGSYKISISDHADFEGTLAYVQRTGAQYVLVDNTRGGNGEVLAASIRDRLGIKASASVQEAPVW